MNIINKIKNFIRQNKKYRIKPTHVTIDISNNCNAKCPFCTRQLSEYSQSGFMSKEIFYDIMHQIKKVKSIKTIILAAWGEPMLHPNFDEFVNYIKESNYSLTYPTNMSLAHKHFDSLLKTDYLMLSIEGWDKESYEKFRKNLTFDVVYENMKKLDLLIKEKKSEGDKVPFRDINFLITKETNIDAFYSLWNKYVDLISVRPMLPLLSWCNVDKTVKLISNKDLDNVLLPLNHKVEKMFCAMPFNIIYVRADGKLALCCSDYDIQLDFGDYKNLIYDFKNNKNLNNVRSEFKKNKLDLCSHCFQNVEISKEDLFKHLPELKKYDADKKIKIYTNR